MKHMSIIEFTVLRKRDKERSIVVKMTINVIGIICIIVALIIFMIGEGIIIWKLRAKIRLANRIRAGYERKCNSFRIKYVMLGKLEKEDYVIENVKKLQKPIYLYGGGVIGNKLKRILETDDQIKIIRVLESEEIRETDNFIQTIQENALIIITPMFDYNAIEELLVSKGISKEKIVGLDEII